MLDRNQLEEKIAKLTQFPHQQRKQNYQSYYIGGDEVGGSRNTTERMELMKVPKDMTGMNVLDLGTNLGSICCESWKRGARHILGLDYEEDYIECAKDLAQYNGYNITYAVKDFTDINNTYSYINSFFEPKPVNIIFALSLYKHIKGIMFEILELLEWNETIIESNNAPNGLETPHVKEIINHIEHKEWEWEHIGTDSTRSPRELFKVTKNKLL